MDAHELHLSVKSKIGVLHEITGFLAGANIDILTMHIQATKGKTADIVAFVEMGESEMSIEDLIAAITELDFVLEATAVQKDRVIFEEFLFPIMIDDEVRGFLMTEGAWMSIATRLLLTYGTGGLAILYEAGVACGEQYGKQLQAKLGQKVGTETAAENLMVLLRAAGMGITEMRTTFDGFVVKVRDPIIPATETKFHDHFLTGVIAGAVGHLFATSYSAERVRFEGNELEFTLGRRHAQGLAQPQPLTRVENSR